MFARPPKFSKNSGCEKRFHRFQAPGKEEFFEKCSFNPKNKLFLGQVSFFGTIAALYML
jgi:hypothetical protein